MAQKKVLEDVMVMRPIVILLLVLMHAFTMYGGAWDFPIGIKEVPAYFWIAKTSFSFMLEAFVFISGYLLCFQFKKKDYLFLPFVGKKAKRLIIPGILFSAFYFLLFRQYKGFFSFLYDIINGCGHLWYLPMIFWCFVMGYILYNIKLPDWSKLLFCIFLSCFSGFFNFLPLQMNNSCYYLLFFYIGIYVYERKEKIISISTSKLITLTLLYAVSFVSFTLLSEDLSEMLLTSLYAKALRMMALPTFKVTYSSLGVVSFYILVNRLLITKIYNKTNQTIILPSWLYWLNSISFGVYIYQQFVLKLLYYHSSLPQFVGTYALPWVGFMTALIVSMILSTLTIKTKFGRFLIG